MDDIHHFKSILFFALNRGKLSFASTTYTIFINFLKTRWIGKQLVLNDGSRNFPDQD
jgi:hypothetical protein